MSFGHALYYPHINLTNKNWIKNALLFWDKLSRIVPQSVDPEDSEEIVRIKSESGFINDYHPERWDTSHAFQEFSRELRPILESDSFFNDRYFRTHQEHRNYQRDFSHRRRLFSESVRSNGVYIHVEKLDRRLKEYLFDVGVAIPGEHEYEDWVKIDNEIGWLYMTYFAKSISKSKSLPIVTDIEQSFADSAYFESVIQSDYNRIFEYRLGNLLIEAVVPKNINDVPIEKLLNIRSKYDGERAAFFNEISSLADSIPTVETQDALLDALNHHSKLIVRETENLERLYNAHKIETVTKFLSVSVPSTFVAASDFVPSPAKPFVAVGGVIFGLMSAASSVKKEKLELQQIRNLIY